MIVKKSSHPYKLVGLTALSQRLSAADLAAYQVMEKIRVARAGVNGEKLLESIFEKYTFTGAHAVFHDLNLRSSGLFQIDTLFLSGQGVTILEMKNIAGRIYFPADRNQMIRTLESGQVDVFECPSVQLKRNMLLLGDWFLAHGFDVDIRGVVVFPTSRQHFENSREGLTIIFPPEVPIYLRSVMERPSALNSPKIDLLTEKLLVGHREYNPFPIVEKYQIDREKIKTGIRCELCGLHGMFGAPRGWRCTSCLRFSGDAHKQAIIDYFMLHGPSLTNRACREFLHLKSDDKARRLMGRMNLSPSGVNKGRTYELSLSALGKWLVELEKD